ncbi:MAG: hypothetical protein P9L96_00460 [Candidatus Gygaella obscura]|nr:hypothetical protein [Candidatus Gygaella obscura]
MAKKDKFNPQIKKIKLNPEQAVLSCNCYNNGRVVGSFGAPTGWGVSVGLGYDCMGLTKTRAFCVLRIGGMSLSFPVASSS